MMPTIVTQQPEGRAGRTTLAVSGAFLGTSADVRHAWRRALEAVESPLALIDLREVQTIDAAAVGLVAEVLATTTVEGAAPRLVASPRATFLLETLGLGGFVVSDARSHSVASPA